MNPNKKRLLSAYSSEFASYLQLLAGDLKRRGQIHRREECADAEAAQALYRNTQPTAL